jgi:site-specific DNA-methyltransferase (adenine-specific)
MPRVAIQPRTELLIRGDLRAVLKDKRDIADLVYFDPLFGTGRDFGAYEDRGESLSVEGFVPSMFVTNPVTQLAPDLPSRTWLEYLASCLVPIRQAAKPTASIWIHVDERWSHLARLLCDRLLSPARWQSTVIWAYRRWPCKARRFQAFHDVLFHYAPEGGTFNVLRDKPTESTVKKWGNKTQVQKQKADGRMISVATDIPSLGPAMGDVWYIQPVAPKAEERKRGSNYPTMKPQTLLSRVILSSSNPGDVVLDPGAGSGTALEVARELGRQWIGIDRSDDAIRACEKRLGVTASSSI